MLVLEGAMMDREYHREQHVESLYLQRMMATTLANIVKSFNKGAKPADALDILPIPELDEHILKAREKRKEEFEKRAEKVLKKYRNLGGKK